MCKSFVTIWIAACQAPLSSGIFQARILEWVAISFSRRSSRPRDGPRFSYIGRQILYHEPPGKPVFLFTLLWFYICMCAKSLQSCPTLFNSMDCSLTDSSVLGFSRLEYWSGRPCPPPGDLPDQGLNPSLLCLLQCRWILHCWATG